MPTTSTRRGTVATIFRVTSGNFLEMYDFFLFGFYASYISRTFFPSDNEFSSLLLTFMTFGAGFLMRPLGAIVLGAYIDRVGRRQGLITTLMLMAVGTIMIAATPGYATVGLLAPALVLVGRLLQGFSAGVELGGVSVYLSEMATPGNKGFYVSWQSGSQQVAIIFAAILGYGLNAMLPAAEISAWGWRIPFFIGCLIVPFIFIIRRSLQETEEFLACLTVGRGFARGPWKIGLPVEADAVGQRTARRVVAHAAGRAEADETVHPDIPTKVVPRFKQDPP